MVQSGGGGGTESPVFTLEGYFGSERSQPQARQQSPGFQHWEDKSPLPLAVKTSGGWEGGRNFRIFAGKGPTQT